MPARPNVDITENKNLLKVLRAGVSSSEDQRSHLAKIKSAAYKPDGEYYVTPEMYEKNMRFLRENGYSSITLADFIKTVRSGQKVPPKTVLLYSDTTRSSFYDLAFPILKKYNFTATLAVETDSVNTSGNLNIAQLGELEDYGIEIASHTRSHPDLTTVGDERLQREIAGSKKILEKWGFDVETFVYPYGAHNDRVVRVVKDAGYVGARATGGPHISDGGGYAGYNEALLYEVRAGLPVNTTTLAEIRDYVLNGSIEIEDICSTCNETGSNAKVARVHDDKNDGLKLDSFASVSLPDTGDGISSTIRMPRSGQYDLAFRVKTGNYVSGPQVTANENAYLYTINGQSYSTSNGTVRTTGPYENEPTTGNIIWGYQHIENVNLQEGANSIGIAAAADWAIVDSLSVEARDKTQEIIRPTFPSIDYDGIFYDSPKTYVVLGINGLPARGEAGAGVAESYKALKKAHLNPALFIPQEGKGGKALSKVLDRYHLATLDLPMFQGLRGWRSMRSFNDPRFQRVLRKMGEERPRAILVDIRDYNWFTEKALDDYLSGTNLPVVVRVDGINAKTPPGKVRSLLGKRGLYKDRMNLILGVAPEAPAAKQDSLAATISETSWWVFLIRVVFCNIFFMCLATAHHVNNRRRRRKPGSQVPDDGRLPNVSIIIPMYNEGESAGKVVQHAMDQTYRGQVEIVLIDDGSSDDTFNLIQSEALKHKNIIATRQSNRGKPSALNNAVRAATGEIIISTDGDSFLDKYAVERIVEKFLEDPEVGAVSGFVRVMNEDDSWITRFSQVEYLKEQALFRGCQGITGDVVICPGPIFAARREALTANPSSDRTIVEDCDQSCMIRKSGWKIAFAPDAISHTLAPTNVKGWINQRLRWFYGFLQVWQSIKDFALRKPWMLFWYLGYPLTLLAFLALIIHSLFFSVYSDPRFLMKVLLYNIFGLSFIIGTYFYSILLLAPTRLKRSTLPWVVLYPFYEVIVMMMRTYLYVKYLFNDGPVIKFGPRTIHALPSQSVVLEDTNLMADSDDVVTSDNSNMLVYLMDENLSEGQRSGIFRAMEGEEKGMLKKLLNLMIQLLDQDFDGDRKVEIIRSLSSAEKVMLKGLLEEMLLRSPETETAADAFEVEIAADSIMVGLDNIVINGITDAPVTEDVFFFSQIDRDQVAFLAQQVIIDEDSAYV